MPTLVAEGLSEEHFQRLKAEANKELQQQQQPQADQPPSCSVVRVTATVACAVVSAVPYGLALASEEVFRALAGCSGTYRVRAAGWSFLSRIYDDVAAFASHTAAYGALRWRWPDDPATTGNRVALTFDDAPGDNPEALARLLDVLKEFGARASFFCTTSTIVGMEALMARIVAEGHEVCNHMPHDRPYNMFREAGFEAELRAAEEALAPYIKQEEEEEEEEAEGEKKDDDPQRRRRRQRQRLSKWFRPPNGAMSSAMARVLAREGYEALLGDVFSNDVFVGGGRRGAEASAATVNWHVAYCSRRTRPGSVLIFHVPRAADRLSAASIARAFLENCKERGLVCVSASELAATQQPQQQQQQKAPAIAAMAAVGDITLMEKAAAPANAI